ncbi:MAG: DUF1385 domain-containing protein [Armatimonadetes bacterium]|nr:DUF1385 domain-containing protein [Armatimonadota bacterium]NIM23538.1 DUF1385 domain-containing protein [Armatimonadota bacterium]NIM67404.1 DUF1385 domain-containing protein [Armatimonadota bacterium]NIM75905.1 DUF1385 domain-containing protein [Armatimonadota bacterium]NIN05590.1 DUF1385 domain-containing protein [Armatimonadota bacterium]
MFDLLVKNVMRDVPVLSPMDSVARAMGLMQTHSLAALVVVWEGRPVGIFSEPALLEYEEGLVKKDWESLPALRVGEVMAPSPASLSEKETLSQAAEVFRAHRLPVLPVVDERGVYCGTISRQDVLAAICKVVSPGPLAGMATPLGVYLTNGRVRAGAGDVGLFLTGVFLALLWTLSSGLLNVICLAVQQWTPLPLLAIREGLATFLNAHYFSHVRLWAAVFLFGQLAGFFLLMRLLPLAGTHGAEHQVVHTIEQGEELTPQVVLSHTTVHPRCGTNLVAMMMVIGMGIYYFTIVKPTDAYSLVFYVSLVVIIALLLRQRIGAVLQWLITTRRPSEKQVVGAIRVGKELLERCQLQQGQGAGFFERVWNIGLLQVLAGVVSTGFVLQTIGEFLEKRLLL